MAVMNVGTRLKQLRIAAGLELKDVAHRLGKSYQYIWKIEEGINDPPTWGLLGDFARVYGCSVDSLLGLTHNMDELDLDDDIAKLIEAINKLPKYRQRDLLAMAELFVNKQEKDNTLALNVVLENIRKIGGEEAENLLLDLLESFGDSFPGNTPIE